jgi:hypothetical protein
MNLTSGSSIMFLDYLKFDCYDVFILFLCHIVGAKSIHKKNIFPIISTCFVYTNPSNLPFQIWFFFFSLKVFVTHDKNIVSRIIAIIWYFLASKIRKFFVAMSLKILSLLRFMVFLKQVSVKVNVTHNKNNKIYFFYVYLVLKFPWKLRKYYKLSLERFVNVDSGFYWPAKETSWKTYSELCFFKTLSWPVDIIRQKLVKLLKYRNIGWENIECDEGLTEKLYPIFILQIKRIDDSNV